MGDKDQATAPLKRPRAPTITVDTSGVTDQNGMFSHTLSILPGFRGFGKPKELGDRIVEFAMRMGS